ncbi:MAG: DNA topoisomerase IB [Verrucomicrobium sp.]|nr:DNA topoisomerase IB [Verrucomicrobium sp.]
MAPAIPGLRYVSDEGPGITRRRQGKAFAYFRPDGKPVRDAATLRRIAALVLPPAWEGVWICPSPSGHIQATGRDARGRKQYRYHDAWRAHRDRDKYGHMMAFARVLPRIRGRVRRDLRQSGLPREKALAAVVRLLETTLIRVGNDEYARENHSYGLTTLHNSHARVRGPRIEFAFRGKSGKQHRIEVDDPRLARIVRRCQELPGQELFCYLDGEGRARDIGSQDVNDYLRAASGGDYTAKDFRTWIGTVLAAVALRELEEVTSASQARKNIAAVVQSVSKVLGNTPAVCRKCYIHPEIFDAYVEGATLQAVSRRIGEDLGRSLGRLRPVEAAVLALLQKRLRAAQIAGKGKGISLLHKRGKGRGTHPARLEG